MVTHHQFAALLLRLFALWLCLSGVQSGLLAYALQASGQQLVAVSYAIAASYVAAALLLWRFPLPLARRILPARDAGPGEGGADTTGAAAVAFVAAGLAIIALKALTPVANYAALVAMLLISGQAERLALPSLHVDGAIGLLMLATGWMLVARSASLARVVGRKAEPVD